MYSFNLGLSFCEGKILCIIVCGSENEINREEVKAVASKHLYKALNTGKNVKNVLDAVMDGIEAECGIKTLLVNADVACIV